MVSKDLMFTDAELFGGHDVRVRFFYKLISEKEQHYIDNPDPKWLLDFADDDRPYILCDGHGWWQAFRCAIIRESNKTILDKLQKNGILTENEISAILEDTIAKYDTKLAKSIYIDCEEYLGFADIPAQKVWQWKGE